MTTRHDVSDPVVEPHRSGTGFVVVRTFARAPGGEAFREYFTDLGQGKGGAWSGAGELFMSRELADDVALKAWALTELGRWARDPKTRESMKPAITVAVRLGAFLQKVQMSGLAEAYRALLAGELEPEKDIDEKKQA